MQPKFFTILNFSLYFFKKSKEKIVTALETLRLQGRSL